MDRDDILEMVAKMDDQFSLSIYKKVYNIDDRELAAKRYKTSRKGITEEA